jgi:probable addiction module antidote protein
MRKTKSYHKFLMEHLRDPREASAYLNAVLEENDPDLFLKALRKVAEATGNLSKIARKARISRVGLYKALSKEGNPTFRTVNNLLRALDVKLQVHA